MKYGRVPGEEPSLTELLLASSMEERKALVALPSLAGRSVAMEVYLVAEKRGKLRMSLSNSSN